MDNALVGILPESRRTTLTPEERQALHKERYLAKSQRILAWLEKPFMTVLTIRVMGVRDTHYARRQSQEVFLLCRQMMRDLDMTYWGFTWELLLRWCNAWEQSLASCSLHTRERVRGRWTPVTKTLLLMDILPYSEHICQVKHTEPAILWLGEELAAAVQEVFLTTGQKIGYYGPRLRYLASIMLCVMALARKRSLAEITPADLRAWKAQTTRPGQEIRDCAIPISRIMVAMGHWTEEQMARSQLCGRGWFNWGATRPKITQTFQRFLDDIASIYRPNTWGRYRIALRRFGDWLGNHYPDVTCMSQIRRKHIEAYKQALAHMKCGEYTSPRHGNRTQNRGQPLSKATQRSLLSNLRSFFQRIELLEYPERPSRKLWQSADLPRLDDPLLRFIPDEDWHRILDAAEHLDPATIRNGRYPLTYLKAVATLLLECGMRGSELRRLDTGCLVVATDQMSQEETYWLRVPMGKLGNDRIIPVSRNIVAAIDVWMFQRGPQPARRDERTGRLVDFLFTYRGAPMSLNTLNNIIKDICQQAGARRLYTSHAFRHTVATKWRNKGMRLETISKLLGHTGLEMTLRYSAVMPPTLRQEFEEAFAAIAEEYRTVAKIRVVLSPDAHLEAQQQWREALWVDLGVGWCGLTAYLPCDSRLKCQRCPNFIPDKSRLPLLEEQRQHLVELRAMNALPAPRQAEMERAIAIVEENILVARDDQPEEGTACSELKTRVGGSAETARTPVLPLGKVSILELPLLSNNPA